MCNNNSYQKVVFYHHLTLWPRSHILSSRSSLYTLNNSSGVNRRNNNPKYKGLILQFQCIINLLIRSKKWNNYMKCLNNKRNISNESYFIYTKMHFENTDHQSFSKFTFYSVGMSWLLAKNTVSNNSNPFIFVECLYNVFKSIIEEY